MFGEVRLTELLTIDKTCIRYMSLTSISLVLVSTVGMCLNTMQTFRYYDANKEPMDNPYLALIEVLRPSAQCTVHGIPSQSSVQVVCISWFTVEYLLRLAGAPDKACATLYLLYYCQNIE